jgi:hypothetical protein
MIPVTIYCYEINFIVTSKSKIEETINCYGSTLASCEVWLASRNANKIPKGRVRRREQKGTTNLANSFPAH